MPEPVETHRPYLAGLDGLRALAVLAVIAYHLHWLPGGLLGVGVFFTLSGYLITDLLVAEWDARGTIRLRVFWLRRARRLLPALGCLLLVVVGGSLVAEPGRLPGLAGQVVAAALYVSNWWDIFQRVPYFARFGPPSPLGHLWSLAVEEQFYLVWPLLLILGLRRVPQRCWLAAGTLGLAALSAGVMAWLYVPGANPDRVYYGTDTRAFSLLIGAALALVWPSARRAAARPRHAGHLAGTLGLLVMVALMAGTNAYQPWMYPYGMVLLAVATAVAIAALVDPRTVWARVLGCRPLRWIGVRSYGIYLWHYPVIVLTTPLVAQEDPAGPRAALQIAATLVLAAASWRWIEDPIRRGQLPWRLRDAGRFRRAPLRWGLVAMAVCGVLAFDTLGLLQRDGGGTSAVPGLVVPAADRGTPPSRTALRPPDPRGGSRPTGAAPLGQGVTIIGDSILVDLAPDLQTLLPGVVLSAQVGRQMMQAPAVIARLQAQHRLGSRVVLELGTNGPFTAAELRTVIRDLGPVRRVVLVNTREPRPWQDAVNATLAAVAATTPHTVVVDWYQASAGQPDYFYPDGVHPNPTGAAVLATLIARAVFPHHAFAPPPAAGG
ncbi:MAG: acetyltransferase [Actinomycetia bacterium]|nr:acetyltransferase [Actinomycetes bacterium]